MRRGLYGALAAGLAAGLLAALAACGSGGKDDGIASVSGAGADPQTSASAGAQSGDREEAMRAFAQCMRDHGVDVPDPQPGGGMVFGGPSAGANRINPDDPAFQKAMEACRSKLPNGGQPPKLSAEQLEQFRQFAQCMRDNGIDMPDPSADGTLQFRRPNASPGTDGPRFSPNDPTFQKALEACKDKRPQMMRPGGST